VPIADPLAKPVGEMKFKTDHAIPCASGNQVLRYLLDASGTGTIEMHYLRPWEKDTPPAKVFKLLRIVRQDHVSRCFQGTQGCSGLFVSKARQA
jgi:hypothetical protein